MSIRKPQDLGNSTDDSVSDPVFPGGLVLDFITDDFEEMASIAPRWDQEYLKLGKGAFKGHLAGFHTSRIQIGRVTWEPGILCRGRAPLRSITLAMLLSKGSAASSQGVILEEDQVLIFLPGREFEFSAVGKSTLLVIAVEEQWFRSYAQACWAKPFVMKNSRDRLILRQTHNQKAIRQQWEELLADVACPCMPLTDSRFARSLETEILEHLLHNAVGPESCHFGPSRRQAAKRAEDYLIANVRNAVTMADLCVAAEANERTLLMGFHEVFGVSPKLFLKSLRLNRVKQDLQCASPGTTVTEVAINWGFNHLSRFAADYRQMFGELPHQTMRRRPKTRPH